MITNLIKKKNLAFVAIMVLSLLVVGCSSTGDDLATADQTGSLKLSITDSSSDSLAASLSETNNQLGIVVENKADQSERYESEGDLAKSELEFAFGDLKNDAQYQITAQVKDSAGNVLYQLLETDVTINSDAITKEDFDLSDYQLGDMNSLATSGNQAKIYYKRGFDTPYIHYAVDGSWTDAPGVAMQDSKYAGYSVITIDLGDATELEAAFNDGNGTWDSNGGSNYIFSEGTSTFEAGTITSGAPNFNQAKIYYKRGFATPYIHYAVNGSWTDAPGYAMQDSSYDGYSVKIIDLGDTTELEAAFNDGNGNWDSNGGSNYFFQQGTWTFDAGSITEGAPGTDTTAPSAPSDLTVDSTTTTEVTISWTAATDDVGVAGYNVYRNGNQIDSTTELNYTDSSLDMNTSYDYTVEAYDEAGNTSDTSNQVTATTDETTLPEIPSDKVNQTMMQSFYWEMNTETSVRDYATEFPEEADLWNLLANRADELSNVGITSLWLPPANKGTGQSDVGYGAYDFWDLGEFDQKGTIRTKYGTKAELENAVDAIHNADMKAYYDVVFNHRLGADDTENVTLTDGSSIEAWTKFDYAGRKKYYTQDKWDGLWHDSNWNWTSFDGTDYDEATGETGLYQFEGKTWGWMQSDGDDYLMGADVDYYNYGSDGEVWANTNVVDEMKAWGEWIVNDIGFDGFRIDAVKHVDSTFINEWIKHVDNNSAKDLFFVGEAWVEDTATLTDYLDTVDNRDTGTSDLKAFDFPLRSYFKDMRDGDGSFDMASLANAGLSNEYGYDTRAVSFLDNHDTSRDGDAYGKEPISKFAYQAYSYILMRDYATPSVFWKDYYQFGMKDKLDKLIKARRYYAYGPEYEVSNNDNDVYSYVREGLADVPDDGLVMMISDGSNGALATKTINSRQPNTTFYDFTGNVSGTVTTDSNGYGDFQVNVSETSGWSVWVPTNN